MASVFFQIQNKKKNPCKGKISLIFIELTWIV